MDISPRSGLPELIAEVERLVVVEEKSVVLVLFDGLGTQFLDERAPLLSSHQVATLRAPFPATTTVSMATVATGLAPSAHGIVGHLLYWPELGRVINMLKFVDLTGVSVTLDFASLLPAPNLWERIRAAGCHAATVQPADFSTTPLSQVLYRGCRFIGAESIDQFVDRTVEAASIPRSLVFTYLPPVDYAAHVYGIESMEVADALSWVSSVWEGIARRLPTGVALMGTADHGVMGIAEDQKLLIRDNRYRPLEFWGDPRAVMVRGSMRLTRELADLAGAKLVEPDEFRPWFGAEEPHRHLDARSPDAVLLAPPDSVILPPGFDKRLRGYHGGLEPVEVDIPLLAPG
ncbi:MAG TPA: alkaline phosphatase family protein [Acidimicrobiia bacterium]|nr:alkaline phosphatase family protein [Acidimicrobiia bacterium]